MTEQNRYPRETAEWQPVRVTVKGEPASPSKLAVSAEHERPTTWVDPVIVDGEPSVKLEGLAPGTYKVWAKVTAATEAPVIDCGVFAID